MSNSRRSLHCWKFLDEFGRYHVEVLYYVQRTLPETGFIVLDAMLLAEAHNQFVSFRETVARHHREQVMVYLVLEAAAQPVYEPIARDVARRGHLEQQAAQLVRR